MSTVQRGLATAYVRASAADRRRRGFVPLLTALGVVLASLATMLAAGASIAADGAGADLHEVSWFHSTPGEVSKFVLFVAPEQGAVELARRIDVGKPTGKAGDKQFFSALVEIGVDEFVAVGAVGKNGIQSALSAWGQPQPSKPGQPLVVDP